MRHGARRERLRHDDSPTVDAAAAAVPSERLVRLDIEVPEGANVGDRLTFNTDAIEHFDLVTHFHVVAFNTDTTFHTVANFRHIVLEATQGFQLAFKDHHVVTQYADRLVPVYGTFGHHTASHLAELR